MMSVVFDQVTLQLHHFWTTNYARLLKSALGKTTRGRRGRLVVTHDPVSATPESIQETLNAVMREIESICGEHDFVRLLTLCRKVPHALARSLIYSLKNSEIHGEATFEAVCPEAVLFATNCILRFCPPESVLASNNERYTLTATNREMESAVQLFLLAVIHTYELFSLNTVNRRDLVEPVSLDALLGAYNRRLRTRWQPRPAETVDQALVFPTLLPRNVDRMRTITDSAGTMHTLMLRNYLPVACDARAELEHYGYLDTLDFSVVAGASFATFAKVWVALNQVLLRSVSILWTDHWSEGKSPETLAALLERTDDYCETALGGGVPESIWTACHQILLEDGATNAPTQTDCRNVIEFLSFRQFDGDVRFIEQPFVFYPVNDRLVLWDYFRHAGLLRCLARDMGRRPSASATRESKGEVLERAVKTTLTKREGVKGVKKWIHHYRGNAVWDVDVGFAYGGIVFLLDCKNEQKSVRYYFDGVEVSDKVIKRERFLEKLDGKLNKYADAARLQWQAFEPLSGAICVVCTVEAEFIPSAAPRWWLSWDDCPRICLPAELLKFLERDDVVARVKANPAYLRFDD
jgi:hypothetical protein